MIWWIVVGLIAGWATGKLMKGSGYGIFMDLLLGLLGSLVGSFVLGILGIGASGFLGSIIIATFGAVICIWIVRQVRHA